MKSPKEIVKSCRDVVKNLSNINILYFFGNGRNQGKILCAYGDSITYQARWYKPVIQAQGLKYIIKTQSVRHAKGKINFLKNL